MEKELIARTDQIKARLFDLFGSVSELVKSGKRDGQEVADTLQVIKDHRDFAKRLRLSEMRAQNNPKPTQNLFVITDDPALKTSEIVAELRKHCKVYVYDEANLDKNFPPPTEKTTRSFKKNVEADEEQKNKSYYDLEREGIVKDCIALRERLLMELQCFQETGDHLDIENVTLCAGSRDLGGSVPRVGWYPDLLSEVRVGWDRPGDAGDRLRARVAVS